MLESCPPHAASGGHTFGVSTEVTLWQLLLLGYSDKVLHLGSRLHGSLSSAKRQSRNQAQTPVQSRCLDLSQVESITPFPGSCTPSSSGPSSVRTFGCLRMT